MSALRSVGMGGRSAQLPKAVCAIWSQTLECKYHAPSVAVPARMEAWVPPAYRGAQTKPRHRGSRPAKRVEYRSSKRNVKLATEGPPKRHPRDSALLREQKSRKEEKEERLMDLHTDLLRLARDYRVQLSSRDLSLIELLQGVDKTDGKNEKAVMMRAMMNQIELCLKDIHHADTPVEWSQIEQTEDHFRGLSRILQDLIVVSSELVKFPGNRGVSEFVDLAELGLRSLRKFGADRALLVDATRKWGRMARRHPELPAEDVPLGRSPGLKGWINTLFDGFPHVDEHNSEDGEKGNTMAHADPDLQLSQYLVRVVIESIAWDANEHVGDTNDNSQDSSLASEEQRTIYDKAARRMMDVLELVPASWLPDAESVKHVLHMLGHAGTLESARTCSLVFQRHPSNQYRLRFSLVLQAYLEAAKHEGDETIRLTVVQEALAALHKQWNANLPSHRVERIMHCKILLHCISVADVSGFPKIIESADSLVKRTVGGAIYSQLLQDFVSDKAQVDPQTLPLVNYLAHIYASSPDPNSVDTAKNMLKYMMQHDRDGVGRFLVFPNVETCNAMLRALIRRYEGSMSIESWDAEDDLDYAKKLLHYMLRRGEIECWPSDTTFDLLFRLLTVVAPSDIGERAEDLLASMEARRALSTTSGSLISLDTYHEVLQCWLTAIRMPSAKPGACTKAMDLLEKLDIQSTPLLLSDREVQKADVQSLYDVSLRPNGKTIKLVLRVCGEAQDPADREVAVDVAESVLYRMRKHGLSASKDLLAKCFAFLPAESDRRHSLEEALQALQC